MDDKLKLTESFVKQKIFSIANTNNDPTARATLANLRRGIGKAPGAMSELWNVTLENMPEQLLSKDGTPTNGEWASYTALTLFALHQQGHDLKSELMSKEGVSLGKAVRKLVASPDDEPRIKRRFDAALACDTPSEFAYHIRGLIKLLKSESIALDYPMLARDIYCLQLDNAKDSVRLRWGQDFYNKYNNKEENEEEKER